jgi:kynurenine formamidase
MDESILEIPPSRWGDGDQLGAAHLLETSVSSGLLDLVGSGRIFDLSLSISDKSPRFTPGMSPYSMCMWSNPIANRHHHERESGIKNQLGFADERVEFDLHTGTHLDALGHVFVGDLTFNRRTVRDVITNWGLRELGIENLPPVIARGVLLDVPAYRGRELEPGELITVSDLEGTLASQGVGIRRGDIVLLRTGWSRYYEDGTERYVGPMPGIGVAAAEWLAARDVVIVGSDTMGLEVFPCEDPEILFPVHQVLLARAGVYILEQAYLEEVAAASVHECLCLCLAIKFVGGTASPLRLVGLA